MIIKDDRDKIMVNMNSRGHQCTATSGDGFIDFTNSIEANSAMTCGPLASDPGMATKSVLPRGS